MRVAFLGLGVMGYPIAGHLARAGHEVAVYNRTADRARRWVGEYGGRAAATPAEAAAGAEFVFACVGNDAHLEAVTLGDGGALAAMTAGSAFVDHTTASASIARRLAGLAAARGVGFLDAPVSGGQVGAERGQLSVMLGGEAADFERTRPVLAAYAREARLLGPAGSGQLAKMVNQICIAGLLQGLSEGLHFAERAGLDPREVVQVISKGAAQSWQMDNRAETMIRGEYGFGFAVDWMRKDLALALDEASRNGALLPVAVQVDAFYADVQDLGGGRWDTSSLIARLRAKTR